MYTIIDWTGNTLFNGKTFKSFDDGWSYITENVSDEDNTYDDYFVTEERER